MIFKDIKLEDKEVIENYLKNANLGIAENCFTSIFIWQEYYSTQFYEDGEFLYLKGKSAYGGSDYYICPVGFGDITNAFNKLYSNFGEDILIISITDEIKEKLEKSMPYELEFEELRDSADYVYSSEKLITLAGKKLHAKRNFVNRFISLYNENYSFEMINSENKHKAWDFHLNWHKISDNEQEDNSLKAETCAIKKLIDNYEELGVVGGLLLVNDVTVGFTVATKVTSDLAVVQIEKCDINYEGVYQMINKTFVETALSDMAYINREEDMGIEGLRKAKLSYRPDIIKMKYSALRVKRGDNND